MKKLSFSFLTIGKTNESTEAAEFARYVGIGSSFVLGVNPNKKQAEEWLGHEIANEPEYISDQNGVPTVRVDFYVKTDPNVCKDEKGNGIEIVNRHTFFLRNQPAVFDGNDGTKYATVIDKFGNSQLTTYDVAKVNGLITTKSGAAAKIAPDYRIAYEGEAEIVAFLKAYLVVDDAFDYVNNAWVLKQDTSDYIFGLEHFQDYFKGDFSELREAINILPNNKVKLLYGLRTSDKGVYQCIATETDLVLPNRAGGNALMRIAKQIAYHSGKAKWAAKFHYEACPLKKADIKATDFTQPVAPATAAPAAAVAPVDDMPW